MAKKQEKAGAALLPKRKPHPVGIPPEAGGLPKFAKAPRKGKG